MRLLFAAGSAVAIPHHGLTKTRTRGFPAGPEMVCAFFTLSCRIQVNPITGRPRAVAVISDASHTLASPRYHFSQTLFPGMPNPTRKSQKYGSAQGSPPAVRHLSQHPRLPTKTFLITEGGSPGKTAAAQPDRHTPEPQLPCQTRKSRRSFPSSCTRISHPGWIRINTVGPG